MAQVWFEALVAWGWLIVAAAMALLTGLVARYTPSPAVSLCTVTSVRRPVALRLHNRRKAAFETARVHARADVHPAMPGRRSRANLTPVWAADRLPAADRSAADLRLSDDWHFAERTAAADQGVDDTVGQLLPGGNDLQGHNALQHFDNHGNIGAGTSLQEIFPDLSKYVAVGTHGDKNKTAPAPREAAPLNQPSPGHKPPASRLAPP